MQDKTREAQTELVDAIEALGWDVDSIEISESAERYRSSDGAVRVEVESAEIHLTAWKDLAGEE